MSTITLPSSPASTPASNLVGATSPQAAAQTVATGVAGKPAPANSARNGAAGAADIAKGFQRALQAMAGIALPVDTLAVQAAPIGNPALDTVNADDRSDAAAAPALPDLLLSGMLTPALAAALPTAGVTGGAKKPGTTDTDASADTDTSVATLNAVPTDASAAAALATVLAGNAAPAQMQSATASQSTTGAPAQGPAAIDPRLPVPAALLHARAAAERGTTPLPAAPIAPATDAQADGTATTFAAAAMTVDAQTIDATSAAGTRTTAVDGPRDTSTSATASTPAAHGKPSLIEALGDRIALQLKRGSESAVIRLDPPMQGHVEITIRHDASGATQVHLSASNSDVARQLQTISDSLRQDLVHRQSGEVTVVVSHGARDQDGRQRQPGQSPEQDNPGRALTEADDAQQPTARFALASHLD
jgi:flagellar hook-length control protein FliK